MSYFLRAEASGFSGSAATWMLAAAELVSWGSVFYAFSLFVVPMEQSMGWDRTSTNAALSVGLLVSGVAAYPVGAWIDRGYGRLVMSAGSVLATIMLLLWSQAQSLGTLFVAWAGLGVAMAAVLYDPVFAVVTRDYPDSFRIKITLITLVGGFASTVFIPLTQFLIDGLGWRGALVMLAMANVAICLPIHLGAIRGNGAEAAATGVRSRAKAVARGATRRALHSPTFWMLAVCFTAYYSTFAALTFHLVPLMIERKVPMALILGTMAVIGPAQVAARALWLVAGRQVHISVVGTVVTMFFPTSVIVLLAAGVSPLMLILFAVMYGAANGMMTILRGTIVQEVMWTEGFGTTSGLISLPSNLAKAIAPISAAAIWSIQQSYVPVEWTILALSLVPAVAFLAAMQLAPRRRLDNSV